MSIKAIQIYKPITTADSACQVCANQLLDLKGANEKSLMLMLFIWLKTFEQD